MLNWLVLSDIWGNIYLIIYLSLYSTCLFYADNIKYTVAFLIFSAPDAIQIFLAVWQQNLMSHITPTLGYKIHSVVIFHVFLILCAYLLHFVVLFKKMGEKKCMLSCKIAEQKVAWGCSIVLYMLNYAAYVIFSLKRIKNVLRLTFILKRIFDKIASYRIRCKDYIDSRSITKEKNSVGNEYLFQFYVWT